MSNDQFPQIDFKGAHAGCYVKVPHKHGLKRVMTGYVLDMVILTKEVTLDIIPLLKSKNLKERQFAVRNLNNSNPELTLSPLMEALENEKDAFTAGILIATLGTLKRRKVVETIDRWTSRADESFVAENIMESYLKIWMDTECKEEKSNKFCRMMYETITRFSKSQNELVAQKAKRILETFNLKNGNRAL